MAHFHVSQAPIPAMVIAVLFEDDYLMDTVIALGSEHYSKYTKLTQLLIIDASKAVLYPGIAQLGRMQRLDWTSSFHHGPFLALSSSVPSKSLTSSSRQICKLTKVLVLQSFTQFPTLLPLHPSCRNAWVSLIILPILHWFPALWIG